MFFDRFKKLCDENNVSIYKAATEIGLNRAAANKWKAGSIPNGQTLTKLADYFGVTNDYLLGKDNEKAPAESDERTVSDKDIKFALFGGDGDITDAMYDEVRNFAAYVKQREANKKKE